MFRTQNISAINTTILYPFITAPHAVSLVFLGLFSLTAHSLILAVVAGGVQFLSAFHTLPKPPKQNPDAKPSMQHEFGRAMNMQARYILAVIIGTVAYTSGAIALYFITSGLFGVGEAYLRKKRLPLPQTVLS